MPSTGSGSEISNRSIRVGRQLALTLALIVTCGVWNAAAQQNIDFEKLELRTVKITEGLYVLMGGPAQGNIAVSVGSDGVYTTTTADGSSYSFARQDFTFRQLRSTLVARWEYRPGSTVFAIWSHGRTGETDDGRFYLGQGVRGLADADSENVVMVKANYWIGL